MNEWPGRNLTPPATLLRTWERTGDIDAVKREFTRMCWGDMYDCQTTLQALLDAVKAEQERRELA